MTYSDIEKSFENTNFSEEQKAFIVAKTWHEFLQNQEECIFQQVIDWILNEAKKYQSKNPLLTACNLDFSKSDEIKKSLFGRRKILELAMKWKSQE